MAKVTDYVANGSFANLREMVSYRTQPDYALLVRLVDFNSDWKGERVYVTREAYDFLGKSSLLPGDVIISNVGANAGTVFRAPALKMPMTLGPNAVVLKTRSGRQAENSFLFYWFRSPRGQQQLQSIISGSAQPKFNKTDLRRLQIPAPPPLEQCAIAQVLVALDEKIELNRRTNETLESMARAIFQDWFIDFGPTRYKVQGRPPYLTPDLWSVFPDRLNDKGKPDGWRNGTLRDVASLNPENWSRSSYPAQIQYVDLSNTKWGTIGSTEPYSKETAPSRAQRVLRPGDTIVGTVRPGNGSYAFIAEDGLTGSTGFAVLRPKQSHYRELIYLSATSAENIEHLAHLADGGAYPAIRPDVVLTTELPGFSDNSAMCFARFTGALLDRVEANKQEIRTLSTMRDTLLPKLLSGELRIKETEEFVGAVK